MVQTHHLLSFIILKLYLYGLGGLPHIETRLIYYGEFSFEDVFYFYEVSYNYAKKAGIALGLALVFSFLLGGFASLFKTLVTLLICVLLLSSYTAMKDDLKDFPDEKGIMTRIARKTSIATVVLLVMSYMLT